ncbi:MULTISPECIES: hypothetical protein [Acinetobacter]|uniref:hypothetical protein n=1 Tax=Acinetobacter TaxID=469 RepID=UPI00036C708F|nr:MULTISPECIES: hypothetical protein [Acinetobacter]MDO7213644.1 hypothetical protein [Acinetobacter nosocomialis]QNX89478.1 hypothetical protein IC772_15360 [Acinetobacter seifertii]
MIFIWQGLGFLAIVVPFLVVLLVNIVVDQIYGTGYYSSHHIFAAGGLIVSAVVIWFLGMRLNNKKHDRILLDQVTGETVILKKKHTFFWIPLQYFSIVLIAFAVFFLMDKS